MDHDQQRPLKPASECIWYVLATIAGQPAAEEDLAEVNKIFDGNKFYWNGLMRERLALIASIYETRLDHVFDLPTLTSTDYEVIRAALDSRGFGGVPIPDPGNLIDFSRVVFSNPTGFRGFVFGGQTSFEGARFNGGLNLFADAVFAGNVSFNGAAFRRPFFGDGMRFAVTASFREARFEREAWFRRSRFLGPTEFDRAHFLAESRFDTCEFVDGVTFVDAEFDNRIDFRAARFLGLTNFEEADFKTLVPEFFGATLNEHTQWHGSEWPKVSERASERRDQITRYQCLSRSMNQLEKFSDQHFFFRKELEIQRRLEPPNVAKLTNWAYQQVCDYGYGLTRMVSVWIGHVALGAVLLCVSELVGDGGEWPKLPEVCLAFADFDTALLLSFGNAHGLLGLNDDFFVGAHMNWKHVPWYDGIGAAQTVLGVIILFLLLLTIRNRFRMR